jgi:hypothetical protein
MRRRRTAAVIFFKWKPNWNSGDQDTLIFTKRGAGHSNRRDGIKVTGYVYSKRDLKTRTAKSVRFACHLRSDGLTLAAWDEIYGPPPCNFYVG